MADDRKPIDGNLGVELLRPAARMVDTYEQPGPSPLRGLAEALSKIDRPLRQFLDQRAEKQADDDRIRGEAAFYDDNAEDLAEGVRTGKIPAQYSPHYVEGYKRAVGDSEGLKLRTGFDAAFDAWEGKNSDDPTAFDQFIADYMAQNVDTTDPDVLKHLLPHMRAAAEKQANRYVEYQHDQLIRKSLDAHVAGAIQEVEEFEREGIATEEGTNYTEAFASIFQKRAEFVASGNDPLVFDKSILDAMSAKILLSRDPGLMAFFEQKVPGTNHTYAESPYGQQVKLSTLNTLEVIGRTQAEAESKALTKAQEKAKDDSQRAAVEFLASNPGVPVPDGILEAGQAADPLFKTRIADWRKNLSEGYTDPERLKGVYDAIVAGGGFKVITSAAANGVFGRPEDLTAAYNFAKSYEDNADRINEVAGSPSATAILKDIDIRTKGKNEYTADPIAGLSPEGYEAQYDFKRRLSDWVAANPNATPTETDEFTAKLGKSIFDRLTPPAGSEGDPDAANIYERPGDLGFENPYSDGTKPAPAAEQVAPEAATLVDPEQQGETDDILKSLSADERAAVEESATRLNMTPQQFIDEMMPQADPATGKPGERTEEEEGTFWDRFRAGNKEVRGNYKLNYAPTSQSRALDMIDEALSGAPNVDADGAPDRPGTAFQGGDGEANSFLKARSPGKAAKHIDGLKPEFQGRLAAFMRDAPEGVTIFSGYRSPAEQAVLWKRALKKYGSAAAARKWVAPPGKSNHNGGQAVDIGYKGGSFKSMPPEVQKWVKGNAKRYGLKLPLGNEDWHVEMQETRGGAKWVGHTHPEVSANTPAPDDLEDRLYSLITGAEAGGNPNAVYGKPNSTRDLSAMTLNDILGSQAAARRRGVASTAVGGPQFVYRTLRGIKKEMGLSGDEPFTADLQKEMFKHLLQRRGIAKFKDGRLSKRAFALRLAQEWASLPNPQTGRSYYAGDGLNKSRVPLSSVYSALGL